MKFHSDHYTRACGLLIGLAAATPGITIPGFPLRLWHCLVVAAFSISYLVKLKQNRGTRVSIDWLSISATIFVVACVAAELHNSKVLNYSPEYASAAYPVFWILIYRTLSSLIREVSSARNFLTWFILPVFPSAVIGLMQVLGVSAVQDAIILLTPGSVGFAERLSDGRLLRATAFVQHWTGYGSYLCTVSAAAGALMILGKKEGSHRNSYSWLAFSVVGIAVATTTTFSSILTCVFVFMGSAKASKSIRKAALSLLVIALVGSLLLGSFFSERFEHQFDSNAGGGKISSDSSGNWIPSTLRWRYYVWESETIPMILERPSTGWGIGVYGAAFGTGDPGRIYPNRLVWLSPESQWFYLLMSYGSLGFFSFLLCLHAVVHKVFFYRSNDADFLLTPLKVLIAFMLLAASTAPVFTNHGLPIGLWALLGVLSGLRLGGTLRTRRVIAPPTLDREIARPSGNQA